MDLTIERTGQQHALPKCSRALSIKNRTNAVGKAQTDPTSLCTIGYGPYTEAFDVAGETIEYVRQRLAHFFNIPESALAVIDGEPFVDQSDVVLPPGCRLEFVQDFGVKGLGPFVTPGDLQALLGLDEIQFKELMEKGLRELEVVFHGERLFSTDAVEQWLRNFGWFGEEPVRLPHLHVAQKKAKGRKPTTAHIAVFVEILRNQGKTMPEILLLCNKEFRREFKTHEELRAIWRRYYGDKSK